MGDYDEDTAFLGQTGPYFWVTFFLLNTVFVSTGFNGLYIIFAGATPKHHCLIPDVNLTEEWRNAIIPFTEVDGEDIKSQCSRYKLDVVKNLSSEGYVPGRDVNLTSLQQEECLDGWTYSKEIYQSTIVTEVSLVCDFLKLISANADLFLLHVHMSGVFHSGTLCVTTSGKFHLHPHLYLWGTFLAP